MRRTAGSLARVLRRHPVAGTLFLVLVAGFAVLSLRALAMALVWATTTSDPGAPLEGWMTPRYVLRLRDVPPDTMRLVLGLPEAAGEGLGARITLEGLAAERGVPLDRFLADVEAGLAAARPQP